MRTIRPEFHRHAARPACAAADAGSESDTDSAADNTGILSLEMRDNPFASLMRRIERLMDTGLHEDRRDALALTRAALLDGMFENRQGEERLRETLGRIIDLLQPAQTPGRHFMISSLGLHDLAARPDRHAIPAWQPAPNPFFR